MSAKQKLLTVAEAESILMEHPAEFGTESRPLASAAGAILREAVQADRPLPPFNRVTMDGIAIHKKAWEHGQREFQVAFTQAAGAVAQPLSDERSCAAVMTGAILPQGADCVIPREEVEMSDNTAKVTEQATVEPMRHVHREGVDARKGDRVLEPGHRLCSADILIAASVGRNRLTVAQPPSVAVVSNGDELVPIDADPEPHQIRMSNSYALQAGLQNEGIEQIEMFHFPDSREAMLEGVTNVLSRFDMAIFSGGVSAGDYDYMPDVLKTVEVRKLFHKVQQRPGKPFWFGLSKDGKPVFALPGNPVSTLVCFHRYVRPWLWRAMGRVVPAPAQAVLAAEVTFEPPLTYFLQVVERTDANGVRRVEPMAHHGSGDYASLQGTDGFIELPADRSHFPAGYVTTFRPWS